MKSGFVSVIGRANAGKSTLINVLVGEKVSIVSPKPQTTRDRIMGVYYGEDTEIAFIDTPGLYKADNMLNSLMQKTAEDSAKETDLVMFVLDAHEGIGERDKKIIYLRYYLDQTQSDVAKELGVSQVQVSRLEFKILEKIKRKFNS